MFLFNYSMMAWLRTPRTKYTTQTAHDSRVDFIFNSLCNAPQVEIDLYVCVRITVRATAFDILHMMTLSRMNTLCEKNNLCIFCDSIKY